MDLREEWEWDFKSTPEIISHIPCDEEERERENYQTYTTAIYNFFLNFPLLYHNQIKDFSKLNTLDLSLVVIFIILFVSFFGFIFFFAVCLKFSGRLLWG